MIIYAELHCHTTFSDGWASPAACVRYAARRGLKILAITDHNTAAGALPYWQQPVQDGVLVIPGEEISTELGHVLAFFVRETIAPGPFETVVANIRDQGALPFMAHPYHIALGNRWRKKPILKPTADHLNRLAGLEIYNGHNRSRANRLAVQLAHEKGLPAIAGSDAHLPWEIGNARTAFDLPNLGLDIVRVALELGQMQALPRRVNAFPVYLTVGVLNRLMGRRYAWRPASQQVTV
ncbi:MAG TPA: CehA/McbA family metallohydrolase [Anaerolineae bacterium]|nr:CehA/McbA family metallohydrolase [Anaerolineae bacterium]